MSEQPNEQDIVDGLRDGDRDAWDALCQQYGGRVCRYVARLVGHNEDATGEVFQETMMAVAKSGRTLARETRLWAWLSRISHNQAALYWRNHYRNLPTYSGEETPDSFDDDPLEQLTKSETAHCVRIVLANMDPEWVALLTARYLDDLSIAQTARSLGSTEASVRNKLTRARDDFRKRFAHIEKPLMTVTHKSTPQQGKT